MKQTLSPTTTKTPVMAMPILQTTEITGNLKLSTHPLRPVVKRSTPQGNTILEPNRLLPRNRRPIEQNQNKQ